MNPFDFIVANAKYIWGTEFSGLRFGSFRDTLRDRDIAKTENQTTCDLHVHPYITSLDDFLGTVRIMAKNRVNVLAITVHKPDDPKQHDYWKVKDMLSSQASALGITGFEDKGLAFSFWFQHSPFIFVPAYETAVHVPGIRGTLDIVALMPDEGFAENIQPSPMLDEHLTLCRSYGAITVGTHPYTIHDPYGPAGFFKFRYAKPGERRRIQRAVFPQVNTIDQVASNCAWMVHSNEQAFSDYSREQQRLPLSNSDAHSTSSWTRNEIGRAANLFWLNEFREGSELRDQFREAIRDSDFKTFLEYTPSLQFLHGVAFSKWTK